jgi:hypothetical protein
MLRRLVCHRHLPKTQPPLCYSLPFHPPLLFPSHSPLIKPHKQTTKDATHFYNGKVADLAKNLVELERVIGGKSENVRIVEDGE